MKDREYRDYLKDILDSINDIEVFIENKSCDEFSKDRKTINAVVRSIEIIGEAAKNLPVSFKNKHLIIPWKHMAGMRDKLIHEYFGVDIEIVWETAKKDVPRLKDKIEKLIKDNK
jgi:uncharacterized protein with HEPN domain